MHKPGKGKLIRAHPTSHGMLCFHKEYSASFTGHGNGCGKAVRARPHNKGIIVVIIVHLFQQASMNVCSWGTPPEKKRRIII
jgi:hypothetical protein